MDDAELYRRRLVRTHLVLFSSPTIAREVQAKGAFRPTELLSQWSRAHVENSAAFDESERKALAAVDAAIEQLRRQAGSVNLPMEQVFLLPAWSQVEIRLSMHSQPFVLPNSTPHTDARSSAVLC
jgi:hypothetical protein